MSSGHISINLSSTFLVRSRCKVCRSTPAYLYQDEPMKIHDLESMLKEWVFRRKSKIEKLIRNKIEPRAFKLSANSYSLIENKISVDSHRSFGISDGTYMYLCKCGNTLWAQAESIKAHSVLHRAAKNYPKNVTIDIEKF